MRRLTHKDSSLTRFEYDTLKRLSTPIKIQNFLDSIPMNWEKKGETHYSPQQVLRKQKAHCIEGALLAATALWMQGEPPLLMDFCAIAPDEDHVVALYKRNGHWGLISKTNHPTIRFRDPVYRTPRELALSYFHEWFMNSNGEKTLESYSRPLNLKRFGTKWVASEEGLWYLDAILTTLPHYAVVPKGNERFIRKADSMELRAGRLVEWPKSNPRT